MGARVLAEKLTGINVRAIIIGEPSSNQIYIAEKGALWLELETCGKTAHGAAPTKGRNAITMMLILLDELNDLQIQYDKHPLLGDFTSSVNTVEGGVTTNVVPDRCTVTMDMRTVPGQDHQQIVRQVEALIDELSEQIPGFVARVRVLNDRIPIMTPPHHAAVKTFRETVRAVTGRAPQPTGIHYYTDATAYEPILQAPMLICGPGNAGLAHQPDEYVTVDKVIEAAYIYARAAIDFLA